MGKIEASVGIQKYKTKDSGEMLKITPAISLDAFYVDPDCPVFIKEAIKASAVWQVRNETSVERALSAPNLLPEITLALLVLDAQILLDDGKTLPVSDFIRRSGTRGKANALLIPVVAHRSAGAARIGVSPTSDPMVAVSASIDFDDGVVRDARVALFGVWPGRQWSADSAKQLIGSAVAELDLKRAAAAVEKEVDPKGNYLGSAEYRRAMAGVLTQRALEMCLKGAK
ncbi:MAG: hypothetical protein K8R77_05275 [Anaerolineaceae bacterium]|nr:hypothetical protein [Anaerolineaceae bacterium]